MRTHTDVDEPHKKKKKGRNSFFNDKAGGWDDVSYHTRTARDDGTRTRPPQEHETQAARRSRGGAEEQTAEAPESRPPDCFIALQGSKRRRLSSSEKKESTDSLMGGLKWDGGVLTNRIQLLYYKQRSEGSRKTGARTTLREKMLCYGAFSSLDSCGN